MIVVLVGVLVALDVQQLVEHELPAGGHLPAHIGAGVLAGQGLGQQAEVLQHAAQPLRGELAPLAQGAELLARVVDYGAERPAGVYALACLEQAAHLLQDDAGAVVEDVPHRGALAVQVADKVFRTLRQCEGGVQVYDLRAGRGLVRVFLGEQFEVFAGKFAHNMTSKCVFRLHSTLRPGTVSSGQK